MPMVKVAPDTQTITAWSFGLMRVEPVTMEMVISSLLKVVPPGPVTEIFPVLAPLGTMKVSTVSLRIVTLVATSPFTVTDVTSVRCIPVSVTSVL